MNDQEKSLEAFQVIGIKTRTTNLEEMNGAGRIQQLWNKFYSEQVTNKITNKLDQNIMAVYYEYESDASGPYSLFIGVKVEAGTKSPEGMEVINIPAQKYSQFTTQKGKMPNIVIDEWKNIWNLTEAGSLKRKYSFDFEMYDSRSADPDSSQAEIWIARK